jgi:exoribonuclease R
VDILIEGPKDRNRALEGDVVVVEVFPVHKWGLRRREQKQQPARGLEDGREEVGKEEEEGEETGVKEEEEEELDRLEGVAEVVPVSEEVRAEAAAEQAWEATPLTKALWQPRVSTASRPPFLPPSLPPSLAPCPDVLSPDMRQALARRVSPTGRVCCILSAKHSRELVGRLTPRTPVAPDQPLSPKVRGSRKGERGEDHDARSCLWCERRWHVSCYG